MKVIAFGASSSKQSINKTIAEYVAQQIKGATITLLDLNDFEMPIYSVDKESEIGIPQQAKNFFKQIGEADALVISLAEHNGSYTAAYKNIFDWVSRINMKVFQGKPVIVLSTSPGPGGAASVLNSFVNSAPYFDGKIVGSLSIPSFFDAFDLDKKAFKDEEIVKKIQDLVELL